MSEDVNLESRELPAEDADDGVGPPGTAEEDVLVVNVDVGIEEVAPTPKRKRKTSANNLAEPSKADVNKYKYKLIHQDPSTYKYKLITEQEEQEGGQGANEVYSLETSYEDGLYHPEQAPTYSDLFQQGKELVIEVDFNDQFGNKIQPQQHKTSTNGNEASLRVDRVDSRADNVDVSKLPKEHRGAVDHHGDKLM